MSRARHPSSGWGGELVVETRPTMASTTTAVDALGRDHATATRTDTPAVLDLATTPGRVFRVLLCCEAFLLLVGAIDGYGQVLLGHASLYGLTRLFDLDKEQTIPSFYSSLQLTLAACLLGLLAAAGLEPVRRWRLHWTILALGFLYLAFDEAASIHEMLARPTGDLLHTPGFSGAWTIPAAVGVVVLAALFLPFLWSLPRRHALLFVAAGAWYVGSAAGLEIVGDALAGRYGPYSYPYQSEVIVEEGGEMASIALFVYALLDYLAAVGLTVRFRVCAAERA
jgi:hypothetical protein